MARARRGRILTDLHWLVPGAAAATYAVLVLALAPRIDAGGLLPLDLRAAGYGPGDVAAYLAALSEAGRAAYLGPVRLADTIFPVLFTLTLVLPHAGTPRAWAWALPAVAYGLCDLSENAVVAEILSSGVAEPATVALASLLTQTKFGTVALAAVLALWRLWRGRARAG